jgi:uncharacterized protein (DUF362 family)
MLDRRRFLTTATLGPLAALLGGCARRAPWERAGYKQRERSRVAVLDAGSYDVALDKILETGLRAFGLPVQGKRIVLKPNLVEFDPAGSINTHPAVVGAAVAAFRRLGAREIVVAEGPAHRRDSEYLLTASGLHPTLKEHRARYVDLNHDEIRRLPVRSHFTTFRHLYLPEPVLAADLLVSMPKLKTHHWAGVTLSLKNMYGIVPGAVYGWPKNTLHWAGIHESILDINSTVPVPQFAIVDGIVGMEGNGPIQGDAKACGALILGDDLVAVDATAARLMTIDPTSVKYLEAAGRFLGNIAPERIVQIGEAPERFRKDFRVIPQFQHLKAARA